MMSSSPKCGYPGVKETQGSHAHHDLFAAVENPQGLLKKQNTTSWLRVGGLGHQNPDY